MVYNLVVTAFLIVMIVTLTRVANLMPIAMLYAFIPLIIMVAVKVVGQVLVDKIDKGNCTVALFSSVLESLCFISLGLGLRKIADPDVTFTWGGLVVPLWIVTALIGLAMVAFGAAFAFRLREGMKHKKMFGYDTHVMLWVFLNLCVLFYLAIHLLIVGPEFGEGLVGMDAFLTPAIVALVYSIVMAIWITAAYSPLQ